MHLTIETRTKINAWLRVLPKRDGQALHELESLFLSVATGDRLHFDAFPSSSAEFHLTSNRPDLVPHNSVQQAWAAFNSAIEPHRGRRTLQISAYLEKRIPEKTGLGAGSGNAGAALLEQHCSRWTSSMGFPLATISSLLWRARSVLMSRSSSSQDRASCTARGRSWTRSPRFLPCGAASLFQPSASIPGAPMRLSTTPSPGEGHQKSNPRST